MRKEHRFGQWREATDRQRRKGLLAWRACLDDCCEVFEYRQRARTDHTPGPKPKGTTIIHLRGPHGR